MPQGNVLPVLPSRPADLAAAPGNAVAAAGAEAPTESFGQLLQDQLAEAQVVMEAGNGRRVATMRDPGLEPAESVGAAADQALVATLFGVPAIPPAQLRQEPAQPEGYAVIADAMADTAGASVRPNVSDRGRVPGPVGDALEAVGVDRRAAAAADPLAKDDGLGDMTEIRVAPHDASLPVSEDGPVASTSHVGDGAVLAGQSGGADVTQPLAVSTPADPRQEARSVVAPSGVGPALQSPRWGEAFSDRVLWIVQGKQPVAELQLNPPQLGPLEVRVSVTADQAALSFFSPHAAVREAIQAALPRLQEALAASGLTLGGFHVGAEAHRERHFAWDHADGRSGGHARAGAVDPSDEPVPARALSWAGVRGVGSVDLFA